MKKKCFFLLCAFVSIFPGEIVSNSNIILEKNREIDTSSGYNTSENDKAGKISSTEKEVYVYVEEEKEVAVEIYENDSIKTDTHDSNMHTNENITDKGAELLKNSITEPQKHVYIYTLDNGLTILVRPLHAVPKVSIQIWYKVGSKDEHDGERGIAHLIEHMIFKGTAKLSESDINIIAHMLSGNLNAFTSYDYTGYLFNMPSQNWKQIFPIMADCMSNCAFKEDMLSSEMKAVIQELKMYRDKYMRSLIDEQVGIIFPDHPYHHPIIGYKQDLWNVKTPDLLAFYKKHYKPNNATLVVVGDVNPDEVYQEAAKCFGDIEPDLTYKKEEFFYNQDITSKSIEMYRDVQQPQQVFTFVVPGSREKKDHIVSLIELVLGHGNSSRLYKKIVDELQLATSLSCMSEELFDHGLFFILVEPKDVNSLDAIQAAIKQELLILAAEGITDEELMRAIKQTKMDLYSLLEENESQAYEIGRYFLATGDPDYVFNYLNYPYEQLKKEANELIAQYLRPTVMHRGTILPLPESEKAEWSRLQKISDEGDQRILSGRTRLTEVEPPVYATSVKVGDRKIFDFPKAHSATLLNGMKVLYYNSNNTPKIDIVMSCAARSYCDSEELPGLYNFVTSMMTEGTKKYTAQEFAHIIESRGMSISVSPGKISMSLLSEDLPFGLEILNEILTNASFDEKEIEKVRSQIKSQIKRLWDEPNSFSGQLVRQEMYKGHPYGKNLLGTEKSIDAITKKDLEDFYRKYVTPQGARIAVVGDLQGYDLIKILNEKLDGFQGGPVAPTAFPVLACKESSEVNYPINRDQVVLFFAGLSVDRKHPDYDKLMLFDQIFGGGVLGSMSSRLFDLREQSGLFYNINGSFVAGADEQPGMVMVKTIVSLDRMAEAEKAIRNVIKIAVDTVTEQELEEAKAAVINTLVNNFSSTDRMAEAFLFVDRYHFPTSFFDARAEQLEKISLEEIKEAVRKIVENQKLFLLRVGRVDLIDKALDVSASNKVEVFDTLEIQKK